MVAKIYKQYDDVELIRGNVGPIYDADVHKSYFIGPHIDGDGVLVFEDKYKALLHLVASLKKDSIPVEQLTAREEELDKLFSMINEIERKKTDENTPTISAFLGEKNTLELKCDGYWDDFLSLADGYWGGWIESFIELRSEELYYENKGNNDIDIQDLIENDETMNYIEYDSDGTDIFNEEFVFHALLVIPFE